MWHGVLQRDMHFAPYTPAIMSQGVTSQHSVELHRTTALKLFGQEFTALSLALQPFLTLPLLLRSHKPWTRPAQQQGPPLQPPQHCPMIAMDAKILQARIRR